MNAVVDSLEALIAEAQKAKGWEWVCQEPLWVTWSLEKFGMIFPAEDIVKYTQLLSVSSVPEILVAYHRSLGTHLDLVDILRPHSVSFEHSRDALAKWVEQACLDEVGWQAKWEDICAAEIERWDGPR